MSVHRNQYIDRLKYIIKRNVTDYDILKTSVMFLYYYLMDNGMPPEFEKKINDIKDVVKTGKWVERISWGDEKNKNWLGWGEYGVGDNNTSSVGSYRNGNGGHKPNKNKNKENKVLEQSDIDKLNTFEQMHNSICKKIYSVNTETYNIYIHVGDKVRYKKIVNKDLGGTYYKILDKKGNVYYISVKDFKEYFSIIEIRN